MTDEERALLRTIAKSTANTLLLVERLASGVREDLGQLYGASLAIDGGVRRIETIVAPKPKLVNGRNDETGRHELIGGVAIEVDDETARRAQNTWAVLRFLGGAIVTAIAAGGWILHYLGAK